MTNAQQVIVYDSSKGRAAVYDTAYTSHQVNRAIRNCVAIYAPAPKGEQCPMTHYIDMGPRDLALLSLAAGCIVCIAIAERAKRNLPRRRFPRLRSGR